MSCFKFGLQLADTLRHLRLDQDAIIAGLVYPSVRYADLDLLDVTEQFGAAIERLVAGTQKMETISALHSKHPTYASNSMQIDRMRRMLFAMVDDIRVVVIKLGERLCMMQQLDNVNAPVQHDIAQGTLAIYAPLANRLGIGAIEVAIRRCGVSLLTSKRLPKKLTRH